jgi:uncharacterized protein (TIGR03435 family)
LPDWAGSTRYDIAAKPEGDKPLSDEELQAALQNLLRQRLGLTAHRETKTVHGFRLVVASSGPKLRPTTGQRETRVYLSSNGLRAPNCSPKELAKSLQLVLGRPVVDETHLNGNFDMSLLFSRDGQQSDLPSVFTAIHEQLGLRLMRTPTPMDVIVIDQVQREPTPN